MIEGFLFFIAKQLLVIAITALLFFAFGWWLRCKLNKCGATLAELEAERTRAKANDNRLKEAETRAKQAEEAIAKVKTEASSRLVGMVPEADLTKAQNALTDEKRKASELQSKIQRSDDGYKALKSAELKIIDLQNDLSKAREEAMRLKTQSSTPTLNLDTEAELARMKNTVRTAETMAGDERRRANELQKEVAALTEKLEKAKNGDASSKNTAVESSLKSKADAELASAKAALKAAEATLAVEKNRVVLLDREFKNAKGLLAQAKSEIEKLKAAAEEVTTPPAFKKPEDTTLKSAPIPTANKTAAIATHQTALSFEETPVPPLSVVEEVKRPEKITIATEVLGKRVAQDDLKIIEGIGPKIEELIHADGIKTWKQLAESSAETLKEILSRAGERFVMHDPQTWPRQSLLAHEGKWDELRAWQDQLDGGQLAEPGLDA
jgi:predicted flap endonuclease-1-like 5' DNA nuclease